jgi:uncharacterized protein (TIGR03437 family)
MPNNKNKAAVTLVSRALQSGLLVYILFPVAMWCQIGNIIVTNGASFQPGLPPNGSIGTVFCTGLTVSGVVTAKGVPLPTSLSGVTVTVRGVPAPLFAVADLGGYQQIDFQVPQEVRSYPADMPFVVSQNGVQGVLTAQPSTPSPGEFFRIGATQFGVFQHAFDYALVTEDNPAAAGETVIAFLTGLPPANPAVPDGEAAPAAPLSVVPQANLSAEGPLDQLGLFIGDNPYADPRYRLFDQPPIHGDSTGLKPIPFIGLAPGMVGVYQINFILPDSAPSGIIPLRLVRDQCGGPTTLFPQCAPEFYSGQNLQFSETVLLPVR